MGESNFTPEARKVIELAYDEKRARGLDAITVECMQAAIQRVLARRAKPERIVGITASIEGKVKLQ